MMVNTRGGLEQPGAGGAPAPFEALLELAREAAVADAVFVYQLDPTASQLNLRFAQGAAAGSAAWLSVALTGDQVAAVQGLRTTVEVDPLDPPLFGKFPEVLQSGFGRLLAAPLRDNEQLMGVLFLGRAGSAGFEPAAVGVAGSLARLFEPALLNDALHARLHSALGELARARTQVVELERKLEERKVIERAKGLLQQQRGMTEHDAYDHIRLQSRRRRVPMVEVAREVIDSHAVPAEQRTASRMTA